MNNVVYHTEYRGLWTRQVVSLQAIWRVVGTWPATSAVLLFFPVCQIK